MNLELILGSLTTRCTCCHGRPRRLAAAAWHPYLWANENAVLVVGAVSANEKRVGPYLLEQVEAGPHDLVDAATRLLGAVGREAIGRRGPPGRRDSATLKLHHDNNNIGI